jgi:hypothetical protein
MNSSAVHWMELCEICSSSMNIKLHHPIASASGSNALQTRERERERERERVLRTELRVSDFRMTFETFDIACDPTCR